MKIHIKTTQLELTPALAQHIEAKIGSVARLIEKFEREGECEAFVEVARTTAHHHKGEVYRAEVNLELLGKVVRAQDTNTDIYAAVDRVKDILKMEITKYKDRNSIDKKKIAEA